MAGVVPRDEGHGTTVGMKLGGCESPGWPRVTMCFGTEIPKHFPALSPLELRRFPCSLEHSGLKPPLKSSPQVCTRAEP